MRRSLVFIATLSAAAAYDGSRGGGALRPKVIQRRPLALGLLSAALGAPVALAAPPAKETVVDEAMLARMQTSRETWSKNANRRGFGFEAGGSMPFIRPDTVGAPPRDRAAAPAPAPEPAPAPAPEPASDAPADSI